MQPLALLPDMFVYEIHCQDDRRRVVGPHYEFSWNLVMVRSGGFLQRLDGREDFYDCTSAYMSGPGQERHTGHPAGPGDVTTGIWLSERLVCDYLDGGGLVPVGRIVTSAGFDLRHRALVAACRRGVDGFEVAERVYDLLNQVGSQSGQAGWLRNSTELAHRTLTARAAEAMAAGYLTASIEDLARLVDCSPGHLSRVFHRVTGHSITAHRNELRSRQVLNELENGQRCLRSLSAVYGFADQAHMTRVIRRHLGTTPSALRDLLGHCCHPDHRQTGMKVQRGRV